MRTPHRLCPAGTTECHGIRDEPDTSVVAHWLSCSFPGETTGCGLQRPVLGELPEGEHSLAERRHEESLDPLDSPRAASVS